MPDGLADDGEFRVGDAMVWKLLTTFRAGLIRASALTPDSFCRNKIEDGYLLSASPRGGEPRLREWREVPVLDGSIVQLQFRWCCTARGRKFLADPAKIALTPGPQGDQASTAASIVVRT